MTAGAPFLPYGRQSIDDDDIAAVVAVLRSDYLTQGPMVEAFETALAARVGASRAVACANGTAALNLAYRAAGLGPGDAVVVPAITFLATASAARLAGAEVAFADVDPDSGLMGPDHALAAMARAEAAGLRVRAIAPVHLAGQVGPLAALRTLAAERGLTVVEDACHAIGTAWTDGAGRTVAVGADAPGVITVFSFHPVKTIAAGEGGAVTTGDAALAERLRRLRNHGMERDPARLTVRDLACDADGTPNPWVYEMAEPAFNDRLNDLQSALALSQLGKLDVFTARRAALMDAYARHLAPLAPLVRPLARTPGCRPAWHLCVALVDFARAGRRRNAVMADLRAAGIGTQVHYIPVHRQPYYHSRYGALALPGAEDYYARALTLPLFPAMADGDPERVVTELGRALAPAGSV
ncbi:UDP-4-amino-4,6-dideoxy-N-acetyl-beta-L-altrosamine transaminase [Azospirillum halopraeferens]|uniref:UDP-4-amino-4, 6-dideoxy-N-acetyl-beta-L-altrosamine transaminase n=1 Tax=Azospirillum halopraeferens TaxID=34010 RepID=UPI0003F781EC|nr:UDP-4-amino-4,6-dideoxy-N-acetyl-beta-L-altrosamine transaminase [Azospirillum halopraeferens]